MNLVFSTSITAGQKSALLRSAEIFFTMFCRLLLLCVGRKAQQARECPVVFFSLCVLLDSVLKATTGIFKVGDMPLCHRDVLPCGIAHECQM
jgi:hypothetical protein